MWIKFLTDDSAPHESKRTLIHVSLQEHRRRFLICSSHSFWWKAAQVTDFCHFLETNIWFDSTIRWFLCVFVFPYSSANFDPMTHLRASAGCDLIIHVVALLVQFLGKETFAKTRVIANKVSASHLSPNKRGKLPHTVCKNTIWLQVYFFISIFYCLKYEQSFQIWKMKPQQKCFKPAVFLAASRGQLHRFHL